MSIQVEFQVGSKFSYHVMIVPNSVNISLLFNVSWHSYNGTHGDSRNYLFIESQGVITTVSVLYYYNNYLSTYVATQGWNSLDTVIAAEDLALTLQSVGRLREAQELLQR